MAVYNIVLAEAHLCSRELFCVHGEWPWGPCGPRGKVSECRWSHRPWADVPGTERLPPCRNNRNNPPADADALETPSWTRTKHARCSSAQTSASPTPTGSTGERLPFPCTRRTPAGRNKTPSNSDSLESIFLRFSGLLDKNIQMIIYITLQLWTIALLES